MKKPNLSGAADFALVIVGLAVATQVALQVADRFRQPTRSLAAVPSRASNVAPLAEYRTGEKLPGSSRLDLSRADHTLLLFVRSTCAYCTASMPFYRKLTDARSKSGVSLNLTVVSSEPQEVLESYIKQYGVAADASVSLPDPELRQYKVRGTPTLVLADRDGVVRKVWVGQLREQAEREVLDLVSARIAVQ